MSIMLGISCGFAVLAGLVHVYIFVLESVIWTSPTAQRTFGLSNRDEIDATRPLAFNQGFYNLFLAIGAILGVVLVVVGRTDVGWTLVVFSCACMLGAAVVLAGSARKYLNSAFKQGSMPFIALLFAFLGSLVVGAS